jgi:hypothetical protein
MKNLLNLSLLVVFSIAVSIPAFSVNPEKANPNITADEYVIQEGPLAGLTVAEAMTMKPREIKAKTGNRLNLGEKLGLKILQRKYRKAKKRGEEFSPEDARDNLFGIIGLSLAGFGFLFGWLVWPVALVFGLAGLVLGIIGLRNDSDPLFSWLSIGFGAAAILIALLIILI